MMRILALECLLAVVFGMFLNVKPTPPDAVRTGPWTNDFPVPAVARLCGNRIVHHTLKREAFDEIQTEGCEDIHFLHIADGYYLAYGTRILIGEGDER